MEIISNLAVAWFVAGAILLLMEFIIPGIFVLFFGIGAMITSLCVYLFHPSLGIQFLIFSSTSILSLVLLRSYLLQRLYKKDNIVDYDEEFVGALAICVEDIEPEEEGKIDFKGTVWRAISAISVAKGEKVKIINKAGLILEVEPA